jgi:hypothetical protein
VSKLSDEIADTITGIIAKNPHGPFPELGQQIRASLRDGQVIDGTVTEVWLDLDIVRVYVIPSVLRFGDGAFLVTPAEGDTWLPL